MFISLPDVPFCSTHQNPFSACPEARLMGEWEHKKKKKKNTKVPSQQKARCGNCPSPPTILPLGLPCKGIEKKGVEPGVEAKID